MNNDMLPEEKLLRLIRKDDLFSLKGLSKKGGRLASRVFAFTRTLRQLIFRLGLLKIIFYCFILSLVILVLSFIYSPFRFRKRIQARVHQDLKLPIMPEEQTEKPLEFYLAEMAKVDIFNIDFPTEGGVSLDVVKDIALVGIINEEPPKAIIKDKESGRTYFLKKGQSLGEYKLLDILEGKIIIAYRGERFEIHL